MAFFGQTGLIDSQTRKQVWVDQFNSLRIKPIHRLLGGTFYQGKDTNFWTEAVSGSGSVAASNGEIVLATGSTANSSAQYRSNNIAPWVTGQENTFRAIAKVTTLGTPNNVKNWGMFDANNGLFFHLNSGSYCIGFRRFGVDTIIPMASWDVPTGYSIDTNYHIWEIKATFADVLFYVDSLLVYSKLIAGESQLLCPTLNLPITLQNTNFGGGTANVSLTCGIAFIVRMGQLAHDSTYRNITGAGTFTLKLGPGRLHRVIMNTTLGSSATIYDNVTATGTKIGTVSLAGSPLLEYNCPFYNGLTLVTVGAGTDLTVIYE